MKKFKFNFKLTAFLVSLFIGLLLLILGNKSEYCLSFGFIIVGLSLALFIWYFNEKLDMELITTAQAIDEIEESEEQSNETVYILQQLYIKQKKLLKSKRSTFILFSLSGFALVVLGLFNLF